MAHWYSLRNFGKRSSKTCFGWQYHRVAGIWFDVFILFSFWFLVVLICENEHLSQKQDLGYWGICLFQALFPNLVSVGTTHCSWYFRGLILGPAFSDVGQRPHSVSLHWKSILEDLLLSLVRIQSFWGHRVGFFSVEFTSSRSGLSLVTPVGLSICEGHEIDIWSWIHFASLGVLVEWRDASG